MNQSLIQIRQQRRVYSNHKKYSKPLPQNGSKRITTLIQDRSVFINERINKNLRIQKITFGESSCYCDTCDISIISISLNEVPYYPKQIVNGESKNSFVNLEDLSIVLSLLQLNQINQIIQIIKKMNLYNNIYEKIIDIYIRYRIMKRIKSKKKFTIKKIKYIKQSNVFNLQKILIEIQLFNNQINCQ